jgi:hypothetical protein
MDSRTISRLIIIIIIIIIIIGVIFNNFKWRAHHRRPALAFVVTENINEAVAALEWLLGPIPPIQVPRNFVTEIYRNTNEFSIYN